MQGRQIITYLDSPSGTSSFVYKTMARPYDSAVNSMYIRLQQTDVVTTKSFIYLLEVVA